MNYKKIILGLCFILIGVKAFAQQETTNDGTSKAHEGVVFNLPAGSWVPVSETNSLVPYIDNKLQEQIEDNKKITVVFSSQGGASTVIDILDEARANLAPRFDNITVVQPFTLLTERVVNSPMKYSAIYRATDPYTGAPMRIEIVVASQWKQKGSKGVLYIITPERMYFDNRFIIADLRNALAVDTPSETKN